MLKLRIGSKLSSVRDDRKLNQVEMAELLGISPSTYSRYERNENSVEFDLITQFAKILQIPVQDFLPETTAIHNNHSGQGGVIFGNFYYYSNKDQVVLDLENQVKLKDQEITFLKDKIELLERLNGLK